MKDPFVADVAREITKAMNIALYISSGAAPSEGVNQRSPLHRVMTVMTYEKRLSPPRVPIQIIDYIQRQSTQSFQLKEQMITLTSNSFDIEDMTGALCFRVKGKLLTLHHRKFLEDSKGNQIIEMEHAVFTLHRQVKLLAGPKGNTTVAIARSKVMGTLSEVSVWLGDKIREDLPDILAKGFFWCREFRFHNRDGDLIAQVTRECLSINAADAGNDKYILHVAPDVDSALMVALVLCIEEFHVDYD